MCRRPVRLARLFISLFLPCVVSLTACEGDTVNDFDCEATWMSRKNEVLEITTREYLQVANEHIAVNRCKKDMLEAVPRGGKRAECKCVGRQAVRP